MVIHEIQVCIEEDDQQTKLCTATNYDLVTHKCILHSEKLVRITVTIFKLTNDLKKDLTERKTAVHNDVKYSSTREHPFKVATL